VGSDRTEWVGLVALAVVGVWLLLARDETAERRQGLPLRALLLLGVAVSVDELAIAFSFGLLGVPLLAAVIAIAVQAAVASQLGLWLGSRAGRTAGQAERCAGLALIAAAVLLAAARLL
jgi:putative Mn2+ efflux pump MntP